MKRGLLILIILLFVSKSLMWLLKPMNGPYGGMGDAQVRVMLVKVRDYIPESGVWMPLPFILIRFALTVYDNVELAPRLLWVIFNGCLMVVLYFFTMALFSSKKVGILAVFSFLLSPFFSAYLTFPLTEPLFALCFLLGIIFLERIPSWWRVLLAGVVFSIANAVRFEGWYLFPFVLGLIFFRKKLSPGEIILFVLIYFCYPLWWMRENFLQTGDYLFFIKEKLVYAQASQSYHWFSFMDSLQWIVLFVQHLGIVSGILLIIGWARLRGKGSTLFFKVYIVSLSLFLLAMLLFQTFIGSMEWFPDQYLYLSLLVLLPIVGKGMMEVLLLLNKVNILLVVICLLFLVSYSFILDYRWLSTISFNNINSQLVERIKDFKNEQKVLVLFPRKDMASDLDYVMYFAGHYSYVGAVIEPETLCGNLSSDDYGVFLSYDTSLGFINNARDCCHECRIIYTDNTHLLMSK